MRFESKRDWWLVVLLRVMPLVVLAIVGYAWYMTHHEIGGPIAGVIVLLVFEIFLFESIMRSTYYVIEGDTLRIRSSFLTWRVPIAKIRSITPTRSALSSPALSVDRLRIDYDGKQIMVSPAEKQQFIEALRGINPAIS
jgi:hypothetical protein